ncbi:SCP2 sterol-binding domain-containing protein [Gammaproteobacteria bacterium]|jgi:putative sterol carrier protein|nr:SCP2 sterol-binding domain-containing protein [Gammaproteobacteria bacterium]MDC0545468.1 SCP2 sterol-binding domain-containing protein [Gammaproteobacteria bacterium]|tara:strand:- start:1179 stop:1505 length:327 start_codon:yes stop_codon:yes gene_type:complete
MATFTDLKNQLEASFNAEGASGVEATIQINIEDLTNFYVDIRNGELSVAEADHEDPGLTLTFDSQETMEKVFSGDQQAAMGAFMQGKVKFSGDMGLGQKLGSVFKAPE